MTIFGFPGNLTKEREFSSGVRLSSDGGLLRPR